MPGKGDYIIDGEHLIYPEAMEILRRKLEKAYRIQDRRLALTAIKQYRQYNLYIPNQLYHKVQRRFEFTRQEMR